MSKIMQNLVFLMEPSEEADNISVKGANMFLNRFCIDEDAAFELFGVRNLQKTSRKIALEESCEFELKRNKKGKEY